MMSDQRERFEEWLVHMDDALVVFKSSLPPEVASNLDLSIDSLDLVERHYLSEFTTVEDALSESAKRLIDGYARYVGETMRAALNTEWDICVSDPKHAFYGLPTIRNNQLCPLTLVTAAADRRTGRFWSTVARSQVRAGA
ncbi:hypothetical protein ACFFGH_34010 [Lysobacter korlensis]|uniref:Uncharacterized protein n=1 Tax=Lysobacter korlensis TaxID=553636 RepID=A0ABV6S0W8_9GAMM